MLKNDFSALIKGKEVSMQIALKELKKIIINSKGIHIDGLSCDMEALREIFLFAEKNNASIDHMHGENIAKFNYSFQRTGGNIASYGEVINRSDYILFIGLNEESVNSNFFDQLLRSTDGIKKKREIHFITEHPLKKSKYLYINVSDGMLGEEISRLKEQVFKGNDDYKNIKDNKLLKIIQSIDKSHYGTIIFRSLYFSDFLINEIINLVKILSETKKFNFLHYSGDNNVAGAIQTSLWKTGFPLRVNFTENGPEYNPLEFNSNYFKKEKELQIYVSCFEENPKINFFSKNVLLGSPKLEKKKLFDIFIPSSVPGIDQNGLIVRGDGVCVEKLEKKKDSKLISIKEIFNFCKS